MTKPTGNPRGRPRKNPLPAQSEPSTSVIPPLPAQPSETAQKAMSFYRGPKGHWIAERLTVSGNQVIKREVLAEDVRIIAQEMFIRESGRLVFDETR